MQEKHQAGPLFAPDIRQQAEKVLEGRLRGKFGAPSKHGAAKCPDKTDASSPSSRILSHHAGRDLLQHGGHRVIRVAQHEDA